MKKELKPCPFCGDDEIFKFKYPFPKPGLKGCYVICNGCGASTGRFETIEEAITAWNRREVERDEVK